ACAADEVAQVVADATAEAREPVRRFVSFPSSARSYPSRAGEMMHRDEWRDAVFVAGGENAAIVLDLGGREFAVFGFDSRPFDSEPVCVEAQPRNHRDIIGIAMILVARVAGRLRKARALDVFEHPAVSVYVAAFDLMCGSGGAPKESIGKVHGSCLPHGEARVTVPRAGSSRPLCGKTGPSPAGRRWRVAHWMRVGRFIAKIRKEATGPHPSRFASHPFPEKTFAKLRNGARCHRVSS